jgi:hypothetical protein
MRQQAGSEGSAAVDSLTVGSAAISLTRCTVLTRRPRPPMPLLLPPTAPTLLIRKSAFERVEMTRAQVDEALGLTHDEFRIEGSLIAIGPLVGEDTLSDLIERLEEAGLVYYDDFFELSGNWPDWLRLFAMDASV